MCKVMMNGDEYDIRPKDDLGLTLVSKLAGVLLEWCNKMDAKSVRWSTTTVYREPQTRTEEGYMMDLGEIRVWDKT